MLDEDATDWSVPFQVLQKSFLRALRHYNSFVATPYPLEEAKDYANHQSACKAALAHMEALLKLIKSLEELTPNQVSQETEEAVSIEMLLASARAEINQTHRQQQEEMEDG